MNSFAYVSPITPDQCEEKCINPAHVLPLIGAVLDERAAEHVAALFRLMADPSRARLIHALSLTRELCVCDLAAVIGVSQSAVSHQLRLLRSHRIVSRRREGRVIYYSLEDDHFRHALADAISHAQGDEAETASA